MTNIMLCGCLGKMGQTVTRLIQNEDELNIIAGVDIGIGISDEFPIYSSPFDFSGKADVIIDFSHPNALEKLLDYSVKTNTPVVIATTGINKEQMSLINQAAKKVPVFFSFNMSLGINLLIQLAKKAASILSNNFDIEIIEKHHNQKIDAPSGTAIMLADAINNELGGQEKYVYDRHAVRKKRDKKEIGISSVRGGTIVGEHTIIFAGEDEVIELTHSAHSKTIFAVGAIKAGVWLKNKKPGLYNMGDLVAD